MKHRIIFEPFGSAVETDGKESVLKAAQRSGIPIEAYCNGQGICGKCRMRVMEGEISGYGGILSKKENVSDITETEKQVLSKEEILEGYRLACMVKVKEDIVVEIPKESCVGKQVILETGTERAINLNPAVRAYPVVLDKPTLEDHEDDFTRIKRALLKQYPDVEKDLQMDYEVLKTVSHLIREGKWMVTVLLLYGKKIIKVVPGETADFYGLAVDIGTTTIAIYLCSLTKGKQVQSYSLMNPQIKYGDDVLTRISYCVNRKEGRKELQGILMEGLNSAIQEMVKKENIKKEDIVETVLVFNTVMEHIALDIPPDYIGRAPFVSAITEPVDIPAKEIGLDILPNGNVHCLPVEGGFVGADNVAVLIAEEPYKQDKMKLIIDIGTNSEICLGNREKLYTTSCATGPALEGAQIYCGMRAAKGAIEKVVIDPKTLEPEIKTIGGSLCPVGICGSGIIDVVAQMALTGILDPDGKFSKKAVSNRIREDGTGKKEYVLYFKRSDSERDIVVKQKDVRAVQLAKAALYAGAKALMKRCGIAKVDEVILAGAFGSYINKANALALGMYPDCKLEKVTISGNAAGMGAKLALLNVEKRKEAKEIARKIEFVETATDGEFQTMFAQAMSIPHEKDHFSENITGKWACRGEDRRVLPEEVIKLGKEAITETETLCQAMELLSRAEHTSYRHLPIMHNIEAAAYGAKTEVISHVYTIREYRYHTIDEISIQKGDLLKTPQIQTLLQYIKEHKGEKLLLDVEGPFSILSGLVNPAELFICGMKKKKVLKCLLMNIAEDLADYVAEAVDCGISVISLADSEGNMELTGEKFYQELSGAALRHFMEQAEPALKNAVMHICGKTSHALEQSGMVLVKHCRSEDKDYIDILFELAKDRKTRFVGNACINKKKLDVPIVTKLELAG